MADLNPQPGMKLLDVAGGTGDIAFRFLEDARSNSKPAALGGSDPASVIVWYVPPP